MKEVCYMLIIFFTFSLSFLNRIGDVMVSVVASRAVDCGFETRSSKTKNHKIDICCFSSKHTALMSKIKDWLGQNVNYVSEWSDMSICGRVFH